MVLERLHIFLKSAFEGRLNLEAPSKLRDSSRTLCLLLQWFFFASFSARLPVSGTPAEPTRVVFEVSEQFKQGALKKKCLHYYSITPILSATNHDRY